jgi:hypothetical protein
MQSSVPLDDTLAAFKEIPTGKPIGVVRHFVIELPQRLDRLQEKAMRLKEKRNAGKRNA